MSTRKITLSLDSEVLAWLNERAASGAVSRDTYILKLLQEDSRTSCRVCGSLHPAFWMVPGRVWRHYLRPAEREAILCLPCWEELVQTIDGGAYQVKYGRPAIIDHKANDRIHVLDVERGYRRFPPGRLTLIGLSPKDWRLVCAALRSSATSDGDRLLTIVKVINFELRNRARFPKHEIHNPN